MEEPEKKRKSRSKRSQSSSRQAKPPAGPLEPSSQPPAGSPPSAPHGSATAQAQTDSNQHPFDPKNLDRTVIAIPLLNRLKEEKQGRITDPAKQFEPIPVIIDLNLRYYGGRGKARDRVQELVRQAITTVGIRDEAEQGINLDKSALSEQYLFGQLEGDVIHKLVELDNHPEAVNRAIYHIWPDFKVKALTTQSYKTVKADAARVSFSALGEDIVWAVLDSGIANHLHFRLHGNLNVNEPLAHRDFTGSQTPLEDAYGHGTHVAGIIAGEMTVAGLEALKVPQDHPETRAFTRYRDEQGEVTYKPVELEAISGMAPKCKLLSLKVLDAKGDGLASSLIAAIEEIQRINGYGRRLQVHGVNMSVGYDFDPEWFACGQSPLCVEVDRLVRSGVVVVVAAGNTGYGWAQSAFRGTISAGMDLTINDPGNAELAITVGSTHRDMPHVYGVSYFSSKGPTGDGRAKPDLVAPGEKILSCAAGQPRDDHKKATGQDVGYREESGTSMAAPHVSGVIAAFLSVRREFIGQPEVVKRIFLSTATDLKRERNFQGYGLVDLMRAIQSI